MCVFIGVVPPETTARIWDCFLQDGRDVLFRCTVALLQINHDEILATTSFEEIFHKLKSIPLGTFDADRLMRVAYEDESLSRKLSDLQAAKQMCVCV